MKYIIIRYILFIILFSSKIYAQDSIVIYGKVKDFYTKQPLSYANISIKGSYIGTTSDIFGKYTFKIPKLFLPIELSANFMGYQETTITIAQKRDRNHTFLLYPKIIDLNEIIVNSEKNVVFGSRDFQILDYILYQNKILFVNYKKRLSKSILLMTDLQGKTISAIPIRGKPIKLYTDCIDQLYLICQSLPYVILLNDKKVRMHRAYQDEYNKLVKPCVANLHDILFYKYMGPLDLSLEYYAYKHKNNDFKLFIRIDDEFQQDLFVNDFNYLLMSNGIKILGNTNSYEALSKFRQRDLKEIFKHEMMHHPIYAPLFVYDDTVIVFDHPNGKIHKFNMLGECIESIEICYEQMRGWQPQIIFDESENKFYTISLKNSISTLYSIDINTGRVNKIKKVPYSWIEKPIISDNILYFLYRRKDKNSAKYLYYEEL